LFTIIEKDRGFLSQRFTRTTGLCLFRRHNATCRFFAYFLCSLSSSARLSVYLRALTVLVCKKVTNVVLHQWSYLVSPYSSPFLDVKMSSNHDNQTKKPNKKQRRKQTRCEQLSTRPPDEESADPTPASAIVQTETIRPTSITNGVQALVLNIPEQVRLCYTFAPFLFFNRAASLF
jgi:hypothetical protein